MGRGLGSCLTTLLYLDPLLPKLRMRAWSSLGAPVALLVWCQLLSGHFRVARSRGLGSCLTTLLYLDPLLPKLRMRAWSSLGAPVALLLWCQLLSGHLRVARSRGLGSFHARPVMEELEPLASRSGHCPR